MLKHIKSCSLLRDRLEYILDKCHWVSVDNKKGLYIWEVFIFGDFYYNSKMKWVNLTLEYWFNATFCKNLVQAYPHYASHLIILQLSCLSYVLTKYIVYIY